MAELDSLTKEAVERLDDANKVAVAILLDALSSSASQRAPGTNGFMWEDVQSLLTQAGYLKPTGQSFAVSKVIRGKRRMRWFKKLGDSGSEPNSSAVYEVKQRISELVPGDFLTFSPIAALGNRPRAPARLRGR